MSTRQPLITTCIALLFGACAGTEPQASPIKPEEIDLQLSKLANKLCQSAPEDWVQLGPKVLARGSAIAPALIAALETEPEAQGEQAALGLLGALPHPQTGPFLIKVLKGHSQHRAEAALALGRLEYQASASALKTLVADHSSESLLRCAAAAASLDLGETKTALPFLHAILLAGTPNGIKEMTEQGLEDKSRWALERHIAIAAIERHCGETFGLDPDLSWPDLAARVELAFDTMKETSR